MESSLCLLSGFGRRHQGRFVELTAGFVGQRRARMETSRSTAVHIRFLGSPDEYGHGTDEEVVSLREEAS